MDMFFTKPKLYSAAAPKKTTAAPKKTTTATKSGIFIGKGKLVVKV